MSQLETNTATIQNLIEKANSLPDAGSGGTGNTGGYETCTVTFNQMEPGSNDQVLMHISATIVENGILSVYNYDVPYSIETNEHVVESLTINNVLCASTMDAIFHFYHGLDLYIETDGTLKRTNSFSFDEYITGDYDGAYNERRVTFQAPTVAGENCIVTYCYEP